jgi:sugar transferase (PEP-CTERM system associated)
MIKIFHHYISAVFLVLFVVEYCIFFAAMYFGSEWRFFHADSWYSEDYIVLASQVFATALSFSLAGIGLYRRNLGHDDYELLSRTAVSFSCATFILVCIYYFFPQFLVARSVLAYALILAFSGMLTCRFIFKKIVGQNAFINKIIVVGCGNNANKILQSKTGYIHIGYEIIGCYAVENETIIVDQNLVLSSELTIFDYAKNNKVDEIVVALDDRRTGMPLDDLLDCKIEGIKIVDLLSFYEREKAYIDLDNLQPSWMVFSDGFAKNGFRTSVKRFVDIVASFTLLLFAFPVMLLTAFAIALESGFRAPVFYRQVRVGANNKNFNVLKFRSMKTDAEKDGVQCATINDNRITLVGGFIRKYRIDELPQIFNVFKGEMSFVGPRPERPVFVEGFNSIPFYKERHRVKPGITGWAQLCYPYGENEYDTIQKLQYDLYYVKNYSLFLDLTIILHTVEVVLWGKGAR